MGAEWPSFLVAAALGLVIWIRLLPRRRLVPLAALGVAVAAATVAAAAAWQQRGREARTRAAEARTDLPTEGRPGGYLSSDACRSCHPSQYASWYRSYHRTMTQYATPETVKAPFHGVPPLPVPGGTILLQRRGDSFWMKTIPADPTTNDGVELRVGLVTGSHHMQVYWMANAADKQLGSLPYAYLLGDRRWVPIMDTFLVPPDDSASGDFGGAWNIQCLRCHTTAGQPGMSADGTTLDSRAAEIGIGCESCHGPGQEHVRQNANPARRYEVALAGKGDPSIVNPRRLSPRRSAETCGQCHSVSGVADPQSFLREGVGFRPGEPLDKYKPPLQPGNVAGAEYLKAMLAEEPAFIEHRFWPDGIVRVIGREWSALRRSSCHRDGKLTCLSCHSMHDSDPSDQLARGREGRQACVQCHDDLRTDPQIAAHTHHPAGSPGSDCYNCHMPYTTYGLLKATRTHFIDSPRVDTTLATGRPNACNLCHLDRSLGWAQESLARWYDQPRVELDESQRTASAAALLALRGDAAQRALVNWAMGWAPAQAASGREWQARYLILGLADPYSAIRYVAGHALQTVEGFRDIEYDYVAGPETMKRSIEDITARWDRVHGPVSDAEKAARLFMSPGGALDDAQVASELARRDNRPLRLTE